MTIDIKKIIQAINKFMLQDMCLPTIFFLSKFSFHFFFNKQIFAIFVVNSNSVCKNQVSVTVQLIPESDDDDGARDWAN